MSTKENVTKRIIDTSLGTIQVSLTLIHGYDVDDMVSQRVRAEAERRRLYLLGQDADPNNNTDNLFPSDFIPAIAGSE